MELATAGGREKSSVATLPAVTQPPQAPSYGRHWYVAIGSSRQKLLNQSGPNRCRAPCVECFDDLGTPAEDRETAATAFASKPADLHYWLRARSSYRRLEAASAERVCRAFQSGARGRAQRRLTGRVRYARLR
jgi:hypothetical protein